MTQRHCKTVNWWCKTICVHITDHLNTWYFIDWLTERDYIGGRKGISARINRVHLLEITIRLKFIFIFSPVFINLDMETQMYLSLKKFLQLLPRIHTYVTYFLPTLPNNDSFLRVLFNTDIWCKFGRRCKRAKNVGFPRRRIVLIDQSTHPHHTTKVPLTTSPLPTHP